MRSLSQAVPSPRPLLVLVLLAAAGLAVAQGAREAPSRPKADSRVADARHSLAVLNAQEADLAQRIGHNRAELARLLGALQLYGRQPPPAMLIDPGQVKDSVRAAILIRAITPALEARARTLSAEAAGLAVVRRRAAAANGDLFAAESAQEDRRSRLEGVMSDTEVLSPPGARVAADSAAPEQPPSSLLAPVAAPRSAGFDGKLADGTRSHGVAFTPPPGAAVSSPAAAVVDYAGPLNGWGQVVILRASGGCHMVLSGLGKLTVGAGQSVAAGQVVGAMPKDGQSARELYLEVRIRGVPKDPSRLLSGTSPKTTPKTILGPSRGAVNSG
ncbi:murein hydrolase activator EnvC family protein [Caulobacter sp. KR2-114]|uniref:murein hydrolase activator EnvC family protein n=1 Tax=Caulobacter sp. KR2-114 TaxID=3400912 RepID=UPI003C0525F0